MTVIKASFVKYNMLADGTLRVVFDVHPNERKIATDLLHQPGDTFAFARLTDESVQKAAQKETIAHQLTQKENDALKRAQLNSVKIIEPTGQLCREAYGYCKEPIFWEWLEQGYGCGGEFLINSEQAAKDAMLKICNKDFVMAIYSRKDFDQNQLAGARFMTVIRDPYRAWVKEQAHDFGNSAK